MNDPNLKRSPCLPQIYVNLKGRVEFRYTNGSSDDVSTWKAQIFAPPGDLYATSKLEFEMSDLEPNSLYRIRIKLLPRDIAMQLTSEILTVKLPAEPQLKLSDPSPICIEC
ncbi:hypothetical protein ACLKA6_004238 [Drosophila palustris]